MLPPESINRERDYVKGNIYALGITLGAWLTNYGYYTEIISKKYGRLALREWVTDNMARKIVIKNIKDDYPGAKFDEQNYEMYQDIISKMTDDDYRDRPTLSEIRDEFNRIYQNHLASLDSLPILSGLENLYI